MERVRIIFIANFAAMTYVTHSAQNLLFPLFMILFQYGNYAHHPKAATTTSAIAAAVVAATC